MKRIFAGCVLVGALSASLVGCGGGSGGGSTASTSTGTTRATVLLTDSVREDFAHVWATIYHVELVPQSGAAVVLFDDPAGHQIDLKTLRDASGERFSFLGSTAVPDGTYTGVNVTVGPTMQLFKNGAATGEPLAVDASIAKDAAGNPVLSLTFRTPKTIASGGTTNILVDFDLARFIVRDSKVLPAIAEGTGEGLSDHNRHNKDDYRGAVSNLTGTAPDLTFTLTRRDGTTTVVSTSAATALFGTGTLASGATVEVRGTLDTTTQVLVANNLEVKTGDANGPRTPRVSGAATNLDAGAGTFTVAVDRACSLTPNTTTVTVVTSATTVFRTDDGSTTTQADFFTALTATPTVDVEGTYDAASGTFTAASVKVVDATQDSGGQAGSKPYRRGGDKDHWGHGAIRKP